MAGYSLFLGFVIPVTGWVLYVLYCLAVNYNLARKTGLPLVILPIDSGNPLWMAVDTKILPYFKNLPFTKNFTRFNYRGWEIHDRFKAHQEIGDAFILVTPGKNWLQLCNAETLIDINARSREFTRPTEMLAMLNVFGPNLGTTEGAQWQRHRKITATCFNENNNEIVWAEVIRQATGMRKYWSSKSSINTIGDDVRTLSLHVMSSAGFGKSYPYQGAEEESATQGSANIRDALKLILDNCIALVALGPKNLDKWWLPKSWKPLHEATVTFQNYMTNAYEEGKQAAADGSTHGNNLMTSLVRASQAESKEASSHGGLTEQEIYGNIFVFNFAGHDTTANTLAFGIALIATRPDVQAWIAEEIKEVFGDQEPETSNYAEIFPRLKRCLAVTYETVRLYTPVAIVKTSGPEPRELKVNNSTHVLPPHTMIIPSYSAMHTHPRHWGSNSLAWEPSRWILPSSNSPSNTALTSSPPNPSTSNLATETFLEFPKASNPFIAWSGGARVCPGRKFSQVEFVGVLVGLFKDYRVKPVQLEGESEKDAIERLKGLIKEDTGFRLLLQLLHPERMFFKWEKRV
ncbi:b9eaa774-2cf2-4e9f-826b-e6514ce54bdb [Sclerotinia trifoliorum]|uniref:B9eaa774-2cf2-4e9f-826b-e6514ce54bdb n=1 Tax=Sclerotinia trifoliorum TaxID=28548 RepID=A0A8H2VWY0_9HELO|nr:b9eaa774-2cf2-4e9f-826b-e6514ce54bdb [Sclerotinia trifoliorum]